MPSPSRGGGPAAMPKYQRIAAALRGELDRAARIPGGKLPSERSLAARYQVNRQTIRAALQHLREDGLVVTGRRGSRPALPTDVGPTAVDPTAAGPTAVDPVALRPAPRRPALTRDWVTVVTVPPSLALLLGMAGGDRTLVHHHRERGPAGETLRHAVTYFNPGVVARSPELAACRSRAGQARDQDLASLQDWLEQAAAGGRVAETITVTRTTHPPAPAPLSAAATAYASGGASGPACGLTVRRTVHAPSGLLLAVTDLAFPTWDHLTFHRDHRYPATAGFRVVRDRFP
ncbi:GntR family transcriptional regulator [Streptomyces sp. NRRL F-2664]|uniref:GntR family transcriptional regulator n=1 Tax=Streptomyces sp. NRRL F-2664 TaxID=1463842 RepID=UPI00068A8724|nr:GntR family transcriptional regulator [Streptomyces sp. NRRL F-2664]